MGGSYTRVGVPHAVGGGGPVQRYQCNVLLKKKTQIVSDELASRASGSFPLKRPRDTQQAGCLRRGRQTASAHRGEPGRATGRVQADAMLRAARGALCRAARHPLLQAGGLEAPAGGATPAFARASAAAAAQAQRIDDTDDEVRRCRPPPRPP